MSDLLNQASLVMVPSGYKEDTVYSVVPSDGAGDLAFTRASNGTRINSAGLVEVVAWNLLQYSEQFTNGVWSPRNGTFTDNFAVAPNGTTTAAKWQATDSDPYIYQAFTGVNVDYTATCWIKATGTAIGKNCSIRIGSDAVFTAMTGEWQQLTITANINGSENIGVEAPESATSGEIVYIWGAQLNIGSTAKPYLPTTDRLNVPRLTYQNGGGGCPSLLLEKQSTNYLKYSEQFEESYWTKAQGNGGSLPIITENYGISPDGTQNADRVQLTRTTQTSSFSYVYQEYIGTVGVAYTWSVWLKSLSGTPSVALSYDGASYANIVTLTNEWQRYTFTSNAIAPTLQATFLLFQNLSSTSLSADFLAWGAQIEASSYATSYIQTQASSATRVADACFKTGISSLIGQSQGTLFVQCNLQDSTGLGQAIATLYENSSNVIILYKQSDNVLKCFVVTGGTLVADLGAVAVSGNIKIAVGYKANDFALYINGVQRGTDTSGSVPTCSNLYLGADDGGAQKMSGIMNQAVLFPTRLSNSELASLTSL